MHRLWFLPLNNQEHAVEAMLKSGAVLMGETKHGSDPLGLDTEHISLQPEFETVGSHAQPMGFQSSCWWDEQLQQPLQSPVVVPHSRWPQIIVAISSSVQTFVEQWHSGHLRKPRHTVGTAEAWRMPKNLQGWFWTIQFPPQSGRPYGSQQSMNPIPYLLQY